MTDRKQELQKYIEKANKSRKEWAQNDALRDAGIKEPEGIKTVTDLSYAESESEDEKKWHLMDIYYPEGKGRHPVIISVHGGGWFYGDKELYRHYTMKLATYGFAVVNFNYRLSPEHPYPAGFMDVCSLVDHLIRHAEEYDLDLEHMYMVGDSAGAQLASQYCIYAGSSDYRSLFPFGQDMCVTLPKRIALNCGVYDGGALYRKDTACDWYLPFYMEKQLALSFFRMFDYMTDTFPETYLMLSVNDALAVYTEYMKNRLEEHGIPYIYREFGENEKSDGHVFHLDLRSKNGEIANREEMEFFSRG